MHLVVSESAIDLVGDQDCGVHNVLGDGLELRHVVYQIASIDDMAMPQFMGRFIFHACFFTDDPEIVADDRCPPDNGPGCLGELHTIVGKRGIPEGRRFEGCTHATVPSLDDIEKLGDIQQVGNSSLVVLGPYAHLGNLQDAVPGQIHTGNGDGCKNIGSHARQEERDDCHPGAFLSKCFYRNTGNGHDFVKAVKTVLGQLGHGLGLSRRLQEIDPAFGEFAVTLCPLQASKLKEGAGSDDGFVNGGVTLWGCPAICASCDQVGWEAGIDLSGFFQGVPICPLEKVP